MSFDSIEAIEFEVNNFSVDQVGVKPGVFDPFLSGWPNRAIRVRERIDEAERRQDCLGRLRANLGAENIELSLNYRRQEGLQ